MNQNHFIAVVLIAFYFAGCSNNNTKETNSLFTLTTSDSTHLVFNNDLPYTEEYNTYTYRNFYNGGGVALGDVNNDGLLDVYFTGNLVDNKLFINKGNWKFEDVTSAAGVACPNVWSTGATIVDINADGLLDIYVCKGGKPGGDNRHNELFINKGNLQFEEQSKEYGLDIVGLSVHSAFFDFDKDGDLDCYLLNNSIRSVGGFDLKKGLRDIPDPEGNMFLINENGRFVNGSRKVGIYSSNIGYGLGITLSDFNNDNWTDVFVSNDFFEKDYLYINQQNGTFKEVGAESFTSMSMGSMGADAADLDNDLNVDLFVTEMLPHSVQRKKTKASYESWDKYQESVANGYHHQYSRNVLQRSLGNGKFLEIGRLAGVADTDWSWAALMQDFDNDGLKDIFVSNGLGKDLLDRDYLNYYADQSSVRAGVAKGESVVKNLIDSMPSQPLPNRMFKNRGEFRFEDVGDAWGLSTPSYSNGSAYGDLDNDGDLDLVVNNVNMPSFIYRNNTNTKSNKYLQIKLEGSASNPFAIGAKVYIKYGTEKMQMAEQYSARGFESSVVDKVHFGVDSVSVIDSVWIVWPDNKSSLITKEKSNQVLTVNHKDAKIGQLPSFKNASTYPYKEIVHPLDFEHKDVDANIFISERLLLEMPGFTGPALAVGDINADGKDDVFCGGGKGQSSSLYLSEGSKYTLIQAPFDNEITGEAVKAEFFDSDGDGDLDLYVAHGGRVFTPYSTELNDKLYLNDGKGNLTEKVDFTTFPYPISTGDLAIVDINKDGKPDIVIGESQDLNLYGIKKGVHLLYNKGNNNYTYLQPPAYKNIGMITAVKAIDVNKDGWKDVVIAGHWMPICILMNDKGKLDKIEQIAATTGLWNTLNVIDVDNDGDEDIIGGNHGLNTFYKETDLMLTSDFDRNGTGESIVFEKLNGKYYFKSDIDEVYSQLPFIKKKYVFYNKCANASLDEIFTAQQADAAQKCMLDELQSCVYLNQENGFIRKDLPRELQYSTINALYAIKQPNGEVKVLVGGNRSRVKPQFGKSDASLAWEMSINTNKYNLAKSLIRPVGVSGEIRQIAKLNQNYIFAVNNEKLKIVEKLH